MSRAQFSSLITRVINWIRQEPDDSYAHKGDDSDVEVIETQAGYMECAGCILGEEFYAWDVAGMVEHMQHHKEAGHTVPVDVIPKLRGLL